MRPTRRWILLALVLAAVEAVYVFIVSAGKMRDWPTYLSYYDLLAEAFRSGHLYLTVQPSPALLAQPDPYALAAADFWMNDLTLYGGRYYFYWGPFPGLLLALAKTVLRISVPVGDQYLVFVFLSLSAVCGALILDRMARRLFAPPPGHPDAAGSPVAAGLLLAAGLLAFALGGPALHLLASTSVYMAAVTGAQAFLLLGLVFASDAVHDGAADPPTRPPRRWPLLAAGSAWGIALACRISVAPAVLLLVVATGVLVARRQGGEPVEPGDARALLRRRTIAALSWIAVPVAVSLVLLLAYNKLRFDAWIEFGVERQLTTWKFRFSLRSFIPNLYSYLVRRFSFSCAVPFAVVPYSPPMDAAMPDWLPFQRDHMTPEPVIGILVAAPITWAIPAAIRAAVRAARAGGDRGYLWFALAFTILGTVTLLAPLGLYMATMRYLGDIAPGLLLLGNLGIWTLYAHARASERARWAVTGGALVLCAATVAIGLALGYQGYTHHFETFNPQLSARLDQKLSLCPGTRR